MARHVRPDDEDLPNPATSWRRPKTWRERVSRIIDTFTQPALVFKGGDLIYASAPSAELTITVPDRQSGQMVRVRIPRDFFSSLRELSRAAEHGLPVAIYTSGDNADDVLPVLRELATALDLDVEEAGPVEYGSWFQRFRLTMRRSGNEVADIAAKTKRAAETAALEAYKSQNTEREANALAALLGALTGYDEAAFLLSSMLIVKTGGVVAGQVLTEEQIRAVQDSPHLMKDPAALLAMLSQSRYVDPSRGARRTAE